MFNDVHVAKVSKINKTSEWSDGAPQKHSILSPRFSGSGGFKTSEMQHTTVQGEKYTTEKLADVEDTMLKLREGSSIFEKTSPRYGTNDVENKMMRSSAPHSLHLEESADSIQKDNNESDNNISSCSTLDIVNKVENLSLLELENHIKELSQRLRNAESQRDGLQRKLDECAEEKELCYRRLELISNAHESRITEMHCVIAELSKKLRARQETTILEENEAEGSEISYQEESVCNSEVIYSNPDANCPTDAFERNYSIYESGKGENLSSEFGKDAQTFNDPLVKNRVEVLQEEILHLKAQIALLQSEIAESSTFLAEEPATTEFLPESNQIEVYSDEGITETKITSCNKIQTNAKKWITNNQVIQTNETILANNQSVSIAQPETLIPKMAEKIQLRNLKQNKTGQSATPKNWNSELSSSGIMELSGSEGFLSSKIFESTLDATEFENEFQRLHRKAEEYNMQNVLLSLTLNECKEHCEELYLLCGKYESNAIALQSAVNCSDRAIEAYDVMLALLESKIALMNEYSVPAEESRKSVESVARNLLVRLDSEKNLNENSLGPWKNTFSFTDKSSTPWTDEDDSRLRYHVSKLKGRRSTVQNTIVNLESPFSVCYEKTRLALEGCSEALFNLQLPTDNCESLMEPNHVALTEQQLVERVTCDSPNRRGLDEYKGLKKLSINLKKTPKKNAKPSEKHV